ncbi:MAG: restriction endonuclease subunit S [Dysgonamonadaceae bacterium]|jgi:type I restriction enzyme M protein|nr:restriction endonuclease subunit S [Dysgonamonadaceae bacterium]
MNYKNLLIALGFGPKENAVNVFSKIYLQPDNYGIEVDFEKSIINYGSKIKSESKTTLNFVQDENFVVLECVDRLLTKGYKPENIMLEKTWGAGHGTSGRLDICVTRDDGSEYLLIECKTFGKEFDKEFARMKRDGGQLFTYFKFSNKADILMLYASELQTNNGACPIVGACPIAGYRNEIVKIEDDYRTGDVKDFYDKWNKLTKDNGVFDLWVKPYNFESKALTPKQLKPILQEDSSFIFNSFLEILRHNVVSDKPNAFNKIFTLFLCKVYDEKTTKPNQELKFQWLEGKDDDVRFQIRLTNLYKDGMRDFLEKEVTDFSEADFDTEYNYLDEKTKQSLLHKINKLRLEKNNEFAIKEVYDEKSFKENAKIVKEVVVLLQNFRLRYNKRQQYLSDFFELLLTTGLKQESGQFFTPVPIAQFIIKSLPIDILVDKKLEKGETNNLLPFLIDYAAGSGHFLTESMHEMQRLLDKKNSENYIDSTAKKITGWHTDHFDWATQYIYGVEKDYRLVKVGKVGCYLHGDGLANVILSDGLANFETSEYKGKLHFHDKDFPKENKQFDILVSNPPYSVSAFKNAAREYYTENDFELYDMLTDNSSEIECLFVERTKQLLKDGGVAGVILPSSILSNEGIYTKAREIMLQYFEIIAITELGSNTFMATGTNTVVLFLRRRNNYDSINLKISIETFFTTFRDVTLNGIENPVAKYLSHVWEGIAFDDYVTLLKIYPNEAVKNHELYKEYDKKIKAKTQGEKHRNIIEIEKEKLLYFILAYPQKNVVLVKTGEKDAEKRFLGYEFSNRRGSEGIHPIQRGKTIDECTRLFDEETFDNPEKASTYIYKAFAGNYDYPIHESLKENISRVRLVDMLTFDRAIFAKNISTAIKKKVRIESKWEVVKINQLVDIVRGASPRPIREFITDEPNGINWIKIGDVKPNSKYVTETEEKITPSGAEKSRFVNEGDFILSNSMSFGRPYIMKIKGCIHDGWLLMTNFDSKLDNDYFYYILSANIVQNQFIIAASGGTSVDNLNIEKVAHILIPLPPKEIQEKIVAEIEVLETKEEKAKEQVGKLKNEITELANRLFGEYKTKKIGLLSNEPMYGANESAVEGNPKTDYRYIRITDINDNGTLNNDWKTAENIEEKYVLKQGDFLFARSGATAGKTFLYTEKYGKALYAGYLIKFETKKELLLPAFLNFILKSDIYKEWVLQKRIGTAQPNINAQQFSSFEIPLPPLSTQQQIVSEIEKTEAQIAVLEQEIAEIPKQKEEILKKYL